MLTTSFVPLKDPPYDNSHFNVHVVIIPARKQPVNPIVERNADAEIDCQIDEHVSGDGRAKES